MGGFVADSIDMAQARSIIFFGDAAQDSEHTLNCLLHAQEGTLLSQFIRRVHLIIQEECLKLPQSERESLPSLDQIHLIFRKRDNETILHPALQSAQVVMVQLGTFIASVFSKLSGDNV